MAANTVDTIQSTIKAKPAHTVTSGTSKFVATSVTNISICLYKDNAFARIFGSGPPRPVPLPSFVLFALRDSLTIFASFNVPTVLAPMLPLSQEVERRIMSKESAAQFLAPAAVQIFSTPIHLLGLDLYNRPRGVVNGSGTIPTWGDRWRGVTKIWAGSAIARMGRIIPAYGVGGLVNKHVRRDGMVYVEGWRGGFLLG
jgi:hypothetical protein